MNTEIQNHVNYLNGLLGEYEGYSLIDYKDDFFAARADWDSNYYAWNSNYIEEKFVDKEGKERCLLLEFTHD